MDLSELKTLADKAEWNPSPFPDLQKVWGTDIELQIEDGNAAVLADRLLILRHEMLALWEAVNRVHLGPCPNPNEVQDVQAIEDAINNLNAKAAALR